MFGGAEFRAFAGTRLVLLAIDVARMGYPRDDHQLFPVVHRVDDAVIANAEAEVIATGKLY